MHDDKKGQVPSMTYANLCKTYQKLENTTKRLEITDILVELLSKSPHPILPLVCYLTTGNLFPPARDLDLGLAEKTIIDALTLALGHSANEIKESMNETGDLGTTTELLKRVSRQQTLFSKTLSVRDAYSTFEKIATTSGSGAVERKNRLVANLITNATPLEAKYLIRTALGKLRLGIAEMTLIDAIALAFTGKKENRDLIERAYNVSTDIGYVVQIAAEQGLEGLKDIKPRVGYPIRMMAAQRLSSPAEILEKHGRTAVETKYDGERLQIHKDKEQISIFSRRLENITQQYPDVVEYIQNGLTVERAIVEGEVVTYNPDTGEFFPFQILMRRRRKYGIGEARTQYPVVLFLFDALLVDEATLLDQPFPERRKILEQITKCSNNIQLASQQIVDNLEDLEHLFRQAISDGHEGLMAKSLQKDAIYQAGGRGWLWIKYKKDYAAEMIDTIDLVVVGAFWGRGKRAGTYGTLLMAAYDDEEEVFKTVSKLGTGFSDEDLVELRDLLNEFQIQQPDARVDVKKEMTPDVWFIPVVVLEIQGAELTLSPIHTVAWDKIKPNTGLAIRFPRYTGTRRPDKAPEQATTVAELIDMYQGQLRALKE
ncbi:MAG: ATP-dependent DNA ligase [Candidatus Heimdallarchaeota archaeon]